MNIILNRISNETLNFVDSNDRNVLNLAMTVNNALCFENILKNPRIDLYKVNKQGYSAVHLSVKNPKFFQLFEKNKPDYRK